MPKYTTDIYVILGNVPHSCSACGKPKRLGERVFTDGEHDFCDGFCAQHYEHDQQSA
jgi:hypothetical protein